VVLDVGGADRLEVPAVEDREVPQRIAAARERGRPDALGVALEPRPDELRERLGARGIDGAERGPPVDLVAEQLGVALAGPDRLPAVPPVAKRSV